MSNISFISGLAFSLMVVSSPLLPASSNFVEGGQAVASIIIPARPSKAETFAAEELQDYIQRMTGAKMAIELSDESGRRPAIVIGGHPLNEGLLKRLNKDHGDTIDAFAISFQNECLSLVGRSETSTIWAAWRWLELMGVRWLMPGEHGAYVPKTDTIESQPWQVIEKPGMRLRGPNYTDWNNPHTPAGLTTEEHGLPANELFSLRMRMNENVGFVKADQFYRLGAGHSYMKYLPASEYFANHPEWYNLRSGQRQSGSDSQLCFTNADAAKQFAANMLPDIEAVLAIGVPQDRIRASVSPNDCYAICECKDCEKIKDADGSTTSQVTNFANLVAREVHKTYPGIIVVFYAYDNYSTPPDHVKPAKNVFPELTAWTAGISFGVNQAHPLMSNANKKFRAAFQRWSSISGGLSAYTYYGHYNWFTPWPMTTQMAKDIPEMVSDSKFYGMYSESHLHWGTQGLTFWLYPQLMWKPSLDVANAVKDYCNAAYGPGAASMEGYFRTLQSSMDGQGYIAGNIEEIPTLLTPAVIAACNKYIDGLEASLGEMDVDMRWRSELAIQSWRNSAKFAEAVRLYLKSDRADRETILRLLDEVEKFSQTKLGEWAFEYRMAKPHFDSMRSALTTNLGDLQAGDSRYKAGFNAGGSLRFFADVSGFETGLWGYSLPVNGRGVIDMPLKAAAGHRVASAKARWDFHAPDNLSATLSVIDASGREKTVSNDVKKISGGVDIPAESLGESQRLKLRVTNQAHNAAIVLTGCQIDVVVE